MSELTKLEFSSSFWKKFRMGESTEVNTLAILKTFEEDYKKYTFSSIDSLLLEEAKILLTKYRTTGLRTLDSIQLATCISIKNKIDKYFTADKLLLQLFQEEGLPI